MAEPSSPAPPRAKRDALSMLGMVAVAGAAAFTSYSGLDGLAQLAGWPRQLAMLLPVTIDAYAMTATRVWLSPARLTRKARAWARGNAVGAIATSVLGNTIFHAAAAHVLSVTWPVVVGISAIPSVVLGLTVHLWHVADDLEPEPQTKQSPAPPIAEPQTVHAAYPILSTPTPTRTPTQSSGGKPTPTPSGPTRTVTPAAGRSGTTPARVAASDAQTPSGRPAPTVAPTWERLLDKARRTNAKALAETGAAASVARLKAEVGVGQGNAQRLRDELAAETSSRPTPSPTAAAAPLPGPRTEVPGVAAPVEHANGQPHPAPEAG